MNWEEAKDIKNYIDEIVTKLELSYIDSKRIFCYRTQGSKARAYARIWSFPKIFQEALDLEPAYVIEVLSEKFEKLSDRDKKRVLIHELLHIPKNFSGSLLPHFRGFEKKVNTLHKEFEKK